MPHVADTLAKASVRKALGLSTSMTVIRSHADLKLLISCWTVEIHTFISCLKFRLPLFTHQSATGIVLSEEEERTQQLLVSSKSTVVPRINTLETMKGSGRGDGGPFFLLAVAVHPPKQAERWHQLICLPSGYSPRRGEEAPLRIVIPKVVKCAAGRVHKQYPVLCGAL